MNIIYHKNLDLNRWAKAGISYQMANIGSEISRTYNWQRKGRMEQADISFDRALELIDITVSVTKSSARLREILRMRELLVAWKTGDKEYENDRDWMPYFDQYAVYANKSRT